MCTNRIRLERRSPVTERPVKPGVRRHALLSWSGSRARQHHENRGVSWQRESRPCGSKLSSSCPSMRAGACTGRWIRRRCPPSTTSPIPSSRRKPGCRWSCWSGGRAVSWRGMPGRGPHCGDDEIPADGRRAVPGLRVLRPTARRAAGTQVSHRPGQRRRGVAHLAGGGIRATATRALPRRLIAAVVGDSSAAVSVPSRHSGVQPR